MSKQHHRQNTLATGRAFESMARDFHAKGDTKRAEQYRRLAGETFERAGHHGHNSTPPPERGSHSQGHEWKFAAKGKHRYGPPTKGTDNKHHGSKL